MTGYKVGDLAAATGLSVRTLHHYDEVGLLVPSGRTSSGHRLYDDADLQRLYRIGRLRQLGLTLGEVRRALDDTSWSLHDAATRHLADLELQLARQQRLRDRLLRLTANPADTQLIEVLEDMTMIDSAVRSRINLLVYADLESAYEYLTRVFGLGPGDLTRDVDGKVVHAEIQAGDGVVWLHPEQSDYGLVSPQTAGVSTACMAIMVDDVDAHHDHAVAAGARIDSPPVDQPYGYREYNARDSENGLWLFMTPLPPSDLPPSESNYTP